MIRYRPRLLDLPVWCCECRYSPMRPRDRAYCNRMHAWALAWGKDAATARRSQRRGR